MVDELGKKDVWDSLWEFQDVLQAAMAGDYARRLDMALDSYGNNPMATLAPAVNLLLDDLQGKRRKQEQSESRLREMVKELENKLRTIEEQALAIRELSTPVMEIWEDVLVLPIVGVVDTRRSMDIMNTLLQKIVESQSKCVIIDVTGVEIIDTKTADYLLKIVRASNLLGTRAVLTGLSPAVAQTLVEIGAELNEVKTLRSLKDGLRECLKFLSQSRAEPKS